VSQIKGYYVITAILAFCVYQGVNFFYFPLETRFGDENRFIREAIQLYEHGVFAKGLSQAWEMPLTAIIYSAFYSLFETRESLIAIVRVFQSLLLVLQAFLLCKISLSIFDDELTAYITFILILFYPFFIFYQGLLLSENIFITLLIISFYYLYCWYDNDFALNKYFVLSNLFFVLTIYSKGTLSVLPPLLLSAFYFINTYNKIRTVKILIFSTVLYSILLSPWWIRNYDIFDQFVPFTTSSGMNLYLGNNPYNLTGGCDWSKDVDMDEISSLFDIKDEKDELRSNQIFKDRAVEFIKDNPGRFLELAILKFKRFYNIVPNADGYNKGYYKWLTLLSYGSILILFIISTVFHIKEYKKLSAIYILFLYITLIHMIVIASLRYRLPLEPFMILMASPLIAKVSLRLRGT